jgi:hypothetical protein
MYKPDNGWQSISCTDCGARIRPDLVAQPFPDARLCPSCVDDLFLTSEPANQVDHQ